MPKHPSIPRTTGHRVVAVGGHRLVPTPYVVLERFDDGEPRTISVVRTDDAIHPDDYHMGWLPESWSRGR